jgi:hypothetical protein
MTISQKNVELIHEGLSIQGWRCMMLTVHRLEEQMPVKWKLRFFTLLLLLLITYVFAVAFVQFARDTNLERGTFGTMGTLASGFLNLHNSPAYGSSCLWFHQMNGMSGRPNMYITLYTILYHYIPLYTIIYHYNPLYTIIYHYIPLYTSYVGFGWTQTIN